MKRTVRGLLSLAVPAPVLGGCARSASFLFAAGPVAGEERRLFFIVAAILMFVAVPIFLGLPFILWRYRNGNTHAAYRPNWTFSKPLEFFIWGGPIVIVATLGWLVWTRTHALDPYKPLTGGGRTLEVQAVGLDWKWLFIYPGQNIATVNRLVIPVGRPVHVDITSDTVMQSLFVPNLAGQIYAMAGMRTMLNLKAAHTGVFLGENTQYSGDGFHKQSFTVQAMPAAAFAAWIESTRRGHAALDDRAYHQLARRSVEPAPLHFASVESGLFRRIIGKYHGQARDGGPGRKAGPQ